MGAELVGPLARQQHAEPGHRAEDERGTPASTPSSPARAAAPASGSRERRDQGDQDGVPDHDPADLVEGGHAAIVADRLPPAPSSSRRTKTCSSLGRVAPDVFAPAHARPGHAAQPDGQGGDVRGPDAGRRGHRRADRLPPRRRAGRGRADHGRLPRRRPGGPHPPRADRGRRPDPARAGAADRGDPRDRRQDRRPGRPRRPGGQRPLQRRARPEREPDAEPAVDADGPVGLRAGPDPDHRGVRRRRADAGGRRASTCSSCTWRTAT